ncbi:MAG: hypothetical protein ABIZ52_00330 [Candidatus Limnocylindrales bacterium]
MASTGGCFTLAFRWLAGIAAAVVLAAACSPSDTRPAQTLLVAGLTDAPPAIAVASPDVSSDPGPEPIIDPVETTPPEDPDPTGAPAFSTAILPGTVDRASLEISATYRVNATITVKTGALDVSTRIVATNMSGEGIDRLELNTIAARLGGIRVISATVDDVPVKVAIKDQTLIVPLGGILPDGKAATVRLSYKATLQRGTADGAWMFSRSGGTLALYRWIPWISSVEPFSRPNSGEPFVTPTSPRVDVEILTDAPMVLAAPAAHVDAFAAGAGNDWSFFLENVRDVSVILAPDFSVATGKVSGIPIRAYTRPGGLSGPKLVQQAVDAIGNAADLLGVAYPWTTLTVVETPGGVNLESPGLIWIPRHQDVSNRTYSLYHGVAHQWFYGLVGNNQRAEPFADEAPSDLLARTSLGTMRATRCARAALDRSIAAYRGACYYEVVLVQGGRLLDDIRRRMGTNRFWAAMGSYLETNRYGLGGTRKLLETLRAASPVDLMPLIRPRFPNLY